MQKTNSRRTGSPASTGRADCATPDIRLINENEFRPLIVLATDQSNAPVSPQVGPLAQKGTALWDWRGRTTR